MKATAVHICVFTNHAPESWGGYYPDIMPNPDKGMYAAVRDASSELFQQEGIEGTTFSVCYAKDSQFQQFLSTVSAAPPFIAIAGTFPGGEKKLYIVKNAAQVKGYLRAMWTGEFGGSGLPTNLGDGDGGWGQGDGGILCKLLPPLCALGFLPWLALAAVTTYKAAESRSTVGRAMWGVPAGLLWLGFFERGGVKQIQWWIKKASK